MWDTIKSALFGAFMVFVGIVMSVGMFREHREMGQLKARGQEMYATTSGASTKTKKGSKTHYLDLEYTVNGQSYNKKRVSVPENVFNRYADGYFYSPSSIRIRYLPEDPKVMLVVDSGVKDPYGYNPALWLFPLGMLAFGGFLIRGCLPLKRQGAR